MLAENRKLKIRANSYVRPTNQSRNRSAPLKVWATRENGQRTICQKISEIPYRDTRRTGSKDGGLVSLTF